MKFRFSSYVIPYLRFCEDRPRTIGTFFAYRLRGRARDYAGKYARALQRSLEFLEGNLAVERVPSVCGGEAWRRTWKWETIEEVFLVYAAPESECSAPSHDARCPRCGAMEVCKDPECSSPCFHEGPLCDDCLMGMRACRIGGGL